MAKEFLQGGGFSAPNLFSSSPCSLASNDISNFGWPSQQRMKCLGCTDDSASDGSSSAPVQDLHNSHHWNQDFLRDREENFSDFKQDYRPQISIEDSSIYTMKQSLNSISSSAEYVVTTCAGQSPGFLPSSDTYSFGSSLSQTLFDADFQPRKSLLNHETMNSLSPLWNSTAAAFDNVPATFFPQLQSQFLPSSISNNPKPERQEGEEDFVKKVNYESAFKRPRIEPPSPLPTFKVRKEKLGDRITALQQLVSPFGKTDTASVLHEAIECIKFLHDQVNALSTPYLKNGSPPIQQHKQGPDKPKDQNVLTKDLKTQGLCLVALSSTFPIASETTTDFWTPTFGGSFR